MRKDPEQLFVQLMLGNAVMIVQPRLGSPADVECRVHMGAAPLHDFTELRPVLHLLEVHVLHRSPGDDHAIEIPVLDVLERGIKPQHVFLRGVLRFMTRRLHEFELHLQRGVGQQPAQLGLGFNLRGHQIQEKDLQGPDVLCPGPVLFHHEDVFVFQRCDSRQVIGDADRHQACSSAWARSSMRSCASSSPQENRIMEGEIPHSVSCSSVICR